MRTNKTVQNEMQTQISPMDRKAIKALTIAKDYDVAIVSGY